MIFPLFVDIVNIYRRQPRQQPVTCWCNDIYVYIYIYIHIYIYSYVCIHFHSLTLIYKKTNDRSRGQATRRTIDHVDLQLCFVIYNYDILESNGMIDTIYR